jgi:methyltransferase (TIGR00027 family)
MRAERPSQTAHLVALGRAMAHAGITSVPNFHDPTALVFLSEKGKRRLARTEQAARDGTRNIRFDFARGLADMMALRTKAIDAAVRDAIAAGARQLVILGAGYDGRAWRMPELNGVRVFEVDHPATQGNKRTHVTELPAPIGTINFVPINFERESLDDVLQRAGHDRSSPTCWIWEGVVMYLTKDAMRATLANIAKRSALGSTLIVNYHTVQRGLITRLILRLIGEPMISHWSPAEMTADLRAAGFVVREDSGLADWNVRFAESRANVERALYMRIAVATT